MADREKVIKGLEMCIKDIECTGCPYEGECFDASDDRQFGESMMRDALALLKEQEAVEPRHIDGKRNHFIKCGNCNYDLLTGYMFCPHCGRAVKWDG